MGLPAIQHAVFWYPTYIAIHARQRSYWPPIQNPMNFVWSDGCFRLDFGWDEVLSYEQRTISAADREAGNILVDRLSSGLARQNAVL
jgi:hypothetical protein